MDSGGLPRTKRVVQVHPQLDSPLARLSSASGRAFPNLVNGREATGAGLLERTEKLASLDHNQDASIVLMGSWGRAEVTSGSDDDFMLLVNGERREIVAPPLDSIRTVLTRSPSPGGPFGDPVFADDLVEKVGLDEDDNKNLTRRMLFLLEAVPVTGSSVFQSVRERVLERYLDVSVKDYQPPRFLLNDVVRFWRTMCVDFAGKQHEGTGKWGIRNAKLRTSRKMLFAGGLLPVLDCFRFDAGQIREFLTQQFEVPPTDRVAATFIQHSAVDAGARTLGAYDDFLGLLDDETFRRELAALTPESATNSDAFAHVERIGRELQAGLLALLFEANTPLPEIVREYGLF